MPEINARHLLWVFFAAGALLLWKVDVERGRKAAREASAAAHEVGEG